MAFAILLYKGYISLKPESNTQENCRKKKPFMLKLSIHTKSKIQQHIRRRHSECCCLNDKCPPQDHIFEHLVPFGENLWNFRGQVLAGGPISLGTVFLRTENH